MITNTDLFKTEALYFQQHGVYPCGDSNSYEYKDYWKEQQRRCIEGYEVGGVKITGPHYDYLNFCNIKLTRDPNANETLIKDRVSARKEFSFPDFWDSDYTYFWVQKIAREGITRRELDSLNLLCKIPDTQLGGGKHVAVAKARRKGYSYKNGAIAQNQYEFYPDSSTLICAYDKKYLYPKGTMSMALDYINFKDKHTGFKKRRLLDRQEHIRSGYTLLEDGIKKEEGYKSEIMALTFFNNSGAARGKDADLILFEEAGKWANFSDSLASTLPLVEDGVHITGQILAFGTGGGDNEDWEGFESLFYNPESRGFIAIENDWDEGLKGTTCSFFVPAFWNMSGVMDKDGNSNTERALLIHREKVASIKSTAKDPNIIESYTMEYPESPSQAFAKTANNIFPVLELKAWDSYLNATQLHTKMGMPVSLYRGEKGDIKYKIDYELAPIYEYPHKKGNSLTGAVVIYDPPYRVLGKIPDNLYILCNDPYAFDNSLNKESLGASYIIMQPNRYTTSKGDKIIASFVGRPESQDEYCRIMFMLAELYNAKIGFENDRGNIIDYAKRFKLLDQLEPEFENPFEDTQHKKLGRKYGISMSGIRKKPTGDLYIKDWLLSPRGEDENGNKLYNYQTIYDRGLLQELIKYNPKGNFDRISALRVAMYYMKELEYRDAQVQEISNYRKEGSIFDKILFAA